MARKKAFVPEPFYLHEFERGVLEAFAHMQAERTPLNDARTERWLKIATAVKNGRPLSWDPKVMEFE